MLAHIVLQALLNLSFSTHGSKQIATCGGIETLVAIVPIAHPVTAIFALRVLDQVTDREPQCAVRLCSLRCVRVLLNLLLPPTAGNTKSPTTTTTAATTIRSAAESETRSNMNRDPVAHETTTSTQDAVVRGAWWLVVEAALSLLDKITSHPRFMSMFPTCGDQLRIQLELVVRHVDSSFSSSSSSDGTTVQQQQHAPRANQQVVVVTRILSRVQRMGRLPRTQQ